MRRIEGMRVAITGASAGIGEALARALAARGARLALCARRIERVEDLARELGGAVAVRADVGVAADCRAFVAAAQQGLGGIDTLVCNAGYAFAKPIAATAWEDWEAILRTNLLGTAECIRAAWPGMVAQPLRDGWRAQAVIVSSALARRGKPDAGAYSATKAAQLSLAEALRLEAGPSAIAVTSVHPVGTATEFDAVVAAGGAPWSRNRRDPEQSAEQVALAIVRGIERPRPEVWPHRSTRWALALAALFPGIADAALRRRWPAAPPGPG